MAAGAAGVLAAFLSVQASRVRFVFGPDALEVVIGNSGADTENAFVGGANRWAYASFVNWEFWWPGFPVLVYFKETQTKPEGQVGGTCWVVLGAVRWLVAGFELELVYIIEISHDPSLVLFLATQPPQPPHPTAQIHFFPLIFNGKQVYDLMAERCGSSVGSGPKAR